MGVTFSTIGSQQVRRALEESSRLFQQSMARLSSGQRINRASDDAAGLAVSLGLDASSRVYTRGITNLNDGISLLNIAEGGLSQLSTIGERLKELASEAANGTYSRTQRLALDTEATALVNEFNRTLSETNFNGLNVLRPNFGSLNIQAGFGSSGSLQFNLGQGLSRTGGDGTLRNSGANGAPTAFGGANINGGLLGDFNGDGKTDGVSLQSANSNLAFSAGNGDGTFNGGYVNTTIDNTLTVATSGDFDGDGDLDLALGGSGSGFRIAFNNGSGSFTLGATQHLVSGITALAALDVDGDSRLDLVTFGTAGASYFRNSGSGTFSYGATISSVTNVSAVTVADFNGDGRVDIAAASATNNRVTTLLGTGGGLSAVVTSLSNAPASIVAGDFNLDGLADIATVGTSVNVLLSNGDGTYAAPATYTGTGNIAAADFNSDGVLDLVTSGQIRFGYRDGTFGGTQGISAIGGVGFATHTLADGTTQLINFNQTSGANKGYLMNTTNLTSIQNFSLATQDYARAAFTVIDNALSRVSKELSLIGGQQSRFQSALGTLAATRDNFTAASNRIKDADIANEAANATRQNILVRIGAALLAQTNQNSQIALDLLRSASRPP